MKFLPTSADGLIELMLKRFPEPRPSPTDSDEEIRHMLSRRSVVLEMRDAYEAAKRKS